MQCRLNEILSCQRVKRYTKLGWPEDLNRREMDFSPYFNQRCELSLENNVLLWGICVVIPFCFQARVMDVLYYTRKSISHIKNLARQYVWWPKIDNDIKMKLKGYSTCTVTLIHHLLFFIHGNGLISHGL